MMVGYITTKTLQISAKKMLKRFVYILKYWLSDNCVLSFNEYFLIP
jgi:hypothetical protein